MGASFRFACNCALFFILYCFIQYQVLDGVKVLLVVVAVAGGDDDAAVGWSVVSVR